ncbi:MAG: hypothetical protein RL637_1887 [Pseudomonadota bacterium]
MNAEKYIQAYNHLMQHLHDVLGDSNYSTTDALAIAKTKTSELNNLTAEEVDKISHFVSRDVDHAATTIEHHHSAGFSDWLKFDIDLLENFALDAFMSVADKTRLELALLEEKARNYHPYHSGDITGPGTFLCQECNKTLAFKSTSQLPLCPNCKTNTFIRS